MLHAVGKINPDALVIAQRLDAERAAGQIRGSVKVPFISPAIADEGQPTPWNSNIGKSKTLLG